MLLELPDQPQRPVELVDRPTEQNPRLDQTIGAKLDLRRLQHLFGEPHPPINKLHQICMVCKLDHPRSPFVPMFPV
jgi:hypothetical protein